MNLDYFKISNVTQYLNIYIYIFLVIRIKERKKNYFSLLFLSSFIVLIYDILIDH